MLPVEATGQAAEEGEGGGKVTKQGDKRALDAMLKRCGPEAMIKAGMKGGNGHQFPVVQLPPPQDPTQALMEELARIQRKAIMGLRAQGVIECPAIPRGWHNWGQSPWREPV